MVSFLLVVRESFIEEELGSAFRESFRYPFHFSRSGDMLLPISNATHIHISGDSVW